MASQVEICNLALSHLGQGTEIADFESDESEQAQACRRYYEQIRLSMLRDFPWNFAKKIRSLVVQDEDPNSLWAFSYRLPSDCIIVRRVLSGFRQDTDETRVEFEIGADDAGGLLFTDKEDAEIEYTFNLKNPERFPADFVLAFSHRLASLMAARLTAGDPNKLGASNHQRYQIEVLKAQGRSSNEEQQDEPPDAEMVQARD